MRYEPEQLTIDTEPSEGVYPLIRSLDRSVRELKDEQNQFRRETSARLSALEGSMSDLIRQEAQQDAKLEMLQRDMTEAKADVKEIRADMSELKGDMKALASVLSTSQTRLNWILAGLGVLIALIEMLKG